VSLVYLITSLPRVDRRLDDKAAPPMSKAEIVRRARHALEGEDRRQLELLLLLDEVDETTRIVSELQRQDPNVSITRLTVAVKTERRREPHAPSVDALPSFVLEPLPRHVLLRRVYQHFYEQGGPFVRGYAQFAVDLDEVLTALVSKKEGLALERFRAQMEGRFDSTSEILVARYERPDLGLHRRFPWIAAVSQALSLDDPRETERALDAIRLDEIDRLSGTAPFSLDVVLAMILTVKLKERHASFHRARGEERLASLLGAALFDEPSTSSSIVPASGGAR